MRETLPVISSFMTPMPYTIAPEASLDSAMTMLQTYRIHHLPVQDQCKLLGILSLHDLSLVALHSPLGLHELKVQSAMNRAVYTISPETPLHLVTTHMSSQKLSAALVVQSDGQLVGIFTDSDALRTLADWSNCSWKSANTGARSRQA